MNVLLDECLPRKLKSDLPGHTVSTVPEMGWAGTKNGTLLRLAETVFEIFITADQNVAYQPVGSEAVRRRRHIFITADQNVAYQQNLRSTVLGIVVLVAPNNRLATLRPLMPKVVLVLPTIQPGDLVHVTP